MDRKEGEKVEKLSDEFKQHLGITDDEERLFDYIYKRERRMKITMAILTVVIIVLSVWMLLPMLSQTL